MRPIRSKVTVRRLADRYSVSVHGDGDAADLAHPFDVNPELDAAMAGYDEQDFYAQVWPGETTVVNIDTKTMVA
jgi:hypothetical protein